MVTTHGISGLDDITFPDGSFEGFEGGTPGVAGHWPSFNQYIYGTTTDQWFAVTSGSSPTCTPPEGTYMAEYNSYSISSGNSAELDGTVLIDFTTATQMKFKMMHDTGYSGSADVIYPLLSADGVNFWYDGTGFYRYDGSTGWKTETMDYSFLISYLGGPGNYYIGFYAVSAYGEQHVHRRYQRLSLFIDSRWEPRKQRHEQDVHLKLRTRCRCRSNHRAILHTTTQAGDVIFHQGYWGPDESWAFDTSGAALGYVVYEDFCGLMDPDRRCIILGSFHLPTTVDGSDRPCIVSL